MATAYLRGDVDWVLQGKLGWSVDNFTIIGGALIVSKFLESRSEF